ncbi:MAG: hypothetical protein KJ057_15470 [Phycisphaerae bacterium]|nr:MAG: hypothetical protein EDS66_11710 [Planctomycetota bacterium]MBE7457920.1 hypothetical protein [Planctomycetia bacterium]MCE7929670.1 hypothetical protein [Chloroflexi bacterium CFX7]MCK6465523.1 hypothetical protein [Phycisphaerae bacterium]MCL4719868.1 hypothetical protein [Phycisphaerae bacterium]
MRNILVILIAVLTCAACAGEPAFAQLTQTTWDGSEGTNWFEGDNWSGSVVPDDTFEAVIPHNPTGGSVWPVIDNSEVDAEAGKLTMTVSGGTRAKLTIKSGSVLILGNGGALTSTVDGDLVLGDGSLPYGSLKINGTHTITGKGGTIELKEKSSIIPLNDTDDLLILTGDSGCTGYPDDRACSLTVFGIGYIAVRLDNRAFVVGKDASKPLKLDGYDMTGTSVGWWIAEDGGSIAIGTDITGACTWLTKANAPGSFLLGHPDVGDGCVAATGEVILKSGLLSVLDGSRFCTSGKLTWKSVDVNGTPSQAQIVTTGAATATFGLGSASSCTACNVE